MDFCGACASLIGVCKKWMDGWMCVWMGGWMDECVDGWIRDFTVLPEAVCGFKCRLK